MVNMNGTKGGVSYTGRIMIRKDAIRMVGSSTMAAPTSNQPCCRDMPKLIDSLRAWPSAEFARKLKSELQQLKSGALPLYLGTTHGGYVDDNDISVTVLDIADHARAIQVKVGIFFTEIVTGCSCGDEPMPTHAYCEMQLTIDKASAETTCKILPH